MNVFHGSMTAEEVSADFVIGFQFIELERIFTQRRQDPENPEKWERTSLHYYPSQSCFLGKISSLGSDRELKPGQGFGTVTRDS